MFSLFDRLSLILFFPFSLPISFWLNSCSEKHFFAGGNIMSSFLDNLISGDFGGDLILGFLFFDLPVGICGLLIFFEFVLLFLNLESSLHDLSGSSADDSNTSI